MGLLPPFPTLPSRLSVVSMQFGLSLELSFHFLSISRPRFCVLFPRFFIIWKWSVSISISSGFASCDIYIGFINRWSERSRESERTLNRLFDSLSNRFCVLLPSRFTHNPSVFGIDFSIWGYFYVIFHWLMLSHQRIIPRMSHATISALYTQKN